MKGRTWASAAILLLWNPLTTAARDPGGEFQVSASEYGRQYLPATAVNPEGEFIVAWATYQGVYVRGFEPGSRTSSGEFQVGGGASYFRLGLSAAADRTGFIMAWDSLGKFTGSASFVRRLGGDGRPLPGQASLNGLFSPAVAADLKGNSLLVATDRAGALARRLSASGRPAGPAFRLGPSGQGKHAAAIPGGFVVVWSGPQGTFGRLVDPSGAPRAAAFRIAATQSTPRVASNARGRFAVTWTTEQGLFARIYRPSGVPLTTPFRVTESAGHAAVAMDAEGKILVVWAPGPAGPPIVSGRRFEASGAPAGRAFPVSSPSPAPPLEVTASAEPGGTFVVAWNGFEPPLSSKIFARRLAWGRAGDAPCLILGGSFACDVAHDGGDEERLLRFGGSFTGLQLLGDLDGDGRDDPCLFRGGSFLCDTAHNGGAAEIRLAFGTVADGSPRLGDLDGDGRDDACLRRDDRFLCDTAHNGGTAEQIVTFGAADGFPLLGDLDGDGDDDPCVVEAGTLLTCDTEHDGGAGEIEIPIDLVSGDELMLGDLDGDGDDDPVLYRDGRFLGDLDHDGSFDDVAIAFEREGALPRLGNVDGL